MDERAERVGKNEAVFRQVNERLKELGESFSLVAERSDFVCECGQATCVDPIQMSLDEYEHVRSNPAWFAILPGHEIPDVERIVENKAAYHIVEKHEGVPARVARESDPRS
jgi:hypothetical protein